MILLIDNYDSFTFNLYQHLSELGAEVMVVRNDQITVDEVTEMQASLTGIVVSPGPCTPAEAGISVELVRSMQGVLPVFGVCLGHQAIGEAFGGNVVRAPEIMHGKTSEIHHNQQGLFAGLPNPFIATRYHSLIVDRESLPPELEVTAETSDGLIMGLRHRNVAVEGVQFHPESILTTTGKQLLRNFLATAQVNLDTPQVAVVGY